MIEYLDRPEFASVRYQINQFSASENAFGSKSHQCGNENGFSIMVNIYGLRSVMEDVGKAMAKIKAYLQQPSRVDPGIQYENPHYFKTPGYDKTPWIESDIEQTEDKDEPSMCGILSKVLNSQLTRSNGLREIDPDPRIKTVLFRSTSYIQGLELSTYSETSDHSCRYKNLISGAWQNHIPQEPRGGIIADEVGLGKTLTMISAIAGSMDEALQFQHCNTVGSRSNAKSTLIVVPLIRRHTVEGSLTVHTYHGSSGKVRGTTPLRDYDVVLTTYATVSSDFSRRKEHSTLFAENWFRIVLDEAHQIRNNKSKQFRAISSLSAQRRWCLTATPIQNNLNDIAALFEYLQVEPIHTQALFKRHIVEPLKADDLRSDDVVSIRNLQLLLITYCLRRQQSLLPQFINENQDEMIQIVEFHADERQNYENLKLECNRAIKDAVCKKSGYGQAYFTVLQTILQLRLFCNHGLFLPAPGMLKSEFGLSNRCGHQACVSCSPKGPLDPETQCVDVENERRPSLQCEERPKEQDAREAVSKKSQRYSRKIGALLEDIQNNPTNEKRKHSIVFSSWVRSLELVEEALKSQGIGCVRVDGKLDSKARKKILRRFREDPYVLVLLMTTGTGAVGLNLTAASRVHILEPQWNPMVEVQAIGRVARLGQRKRVTIYRYIMANTIEEVDIGPQDTP
ncbi:SNF2 family N-terminal domain-containing protein [Tirmania nivea]|nr:SNF2 family N-terminal domain-containing protein [Tirmania nivea]